MQKRSLAVLILLLATVGNLSRAEVPNRSPEHLRDKATHIVMGDVIAVYVRFTVEGSWEYTRYLTEIRVTAVEKGDAVATSEPIYVHSFTRRWKNGEPPPDTYGHRGLPKEGDHVRVFLAHNAGDGFSESGKQGAFQVMYPNGFEIVTAVKIP